MPIILALLIVEASGSQVLTQMACYVPNEILSQKEWRRAWDVAKCEDPGFTPWFNQWPLLKNKTKQHLYD